MRWMAAKTLRASLGRAVLPAAAIMPHEHALLLGDEEIIGGSNPTRAIADVDAGATTTRRSMCSVRRTPTAIATQRSVRHGTGSHRRTAGAGCACASHDALDSHLLGIDVAIEPLTELRSTKLTWYVGLDSEPPYRRPALHGETSMSGLRRVLALFALPLPIPRW